MTISIKGWSNFQHFKDRRPPWIKLYRELLDDVEWHELDPKAAKALVMLWLIASEDEGRLPDAKTLAFRLRISVSDVKSLIIKLNHWLIQDDINLISTRYQSDIPETETETERETKKEGENIQKNWAPEGVSQDVWDSFVQQRKKARAVITPTVVETIAKEAAKANWTLEEALAECAARGWRGFKAEWVTAKHDSSLDTYFDN
jgi:hypothetical protein